MAASDPAAFAVMASRTSWKPYPHLLLIAEKLQQVFHGECRRLIVEMPPRHGKSEFISKYWPAYFLIRNPDLRVILASYESDFAASWGRKAREVVEDMGPYFGVRVKGQSSAAMRWDLEGREGGMVSCGARGPLSGRGMDLGIIDDPVKNDEEANSESYREKIWDWYLSTFSTRLHKGGSIIIVMTRWNEDDLVGRLLESEKAGGEKWDVLNLPAIAEKDEDYGLMKRKEGESLCPELIPHTMLEDIKGRLGEYWWGALYQQSPFPKGGGIFKRDMIRTVNAIPQSAIAVRAWDLAASKTGKRTAGVLLAKTVDNEYIVGDVFTGKLEPAARDAMIRKVAERDGSNIPIKIEQEPGSGGLAQIHTLVKKLAGFSVEGIRITGDKITRADPMASQSNVGNMTIVKGDWNDRFLSELEAFPTGTDCDQVDALSLGFGYLCMRSASMGFYKVPAHLKKNPIDEILEGSRDRMFDRGDWRDNLPT